MEIKEELTKEITVENFNYSNVKEMETISLSDYVAEYHGGNYAQTARSLTNYSTKKSMTQPSIYVNSKSDAFIVLIEHNKHTLCKISATSIDTQNF